MNARITTILTALILSSTFVSSTALAWSVPIHKCRFPDTPTPAGDPIPCSYTNQDGQTWNGVVTVTGNGEVLCTGLTAPTPEDPTEADSIEELYASFGDNYDEAPFCALAGSREGPEAVCYDKAPVSNPEAAIQVCGDGWCLELAAYADCRDYNSTEIQLEGVTCYDLY